MFTYSSAKASRLALSTKPRGIAYMFVMHVAEELHKWPEADKRTRLWVSSMSKFQPPGTLLLVLILIWDCTAPQLRNSHARDV